MQHKLIIFSDGTFHGLTLHDLQVNKSMGHRLRGEFTNKKRQQAIFELLGPTYVAIYFPHYEVRTINKARIGTVFDKIRIFETSFSESDFSTRPDSYLTLCFTGYTKNLTGCWLLLKKKTDFH